MPVLPSPLLRERVAGRVAVLAGAVMAAVGAIFATRPDIQPEVVSRPVEHVILAGLATLLVLSIPPTLALGRRAGGALGRRGAAVAVAGQVALAVTCTTSNVNGGDPEWFVVAAPIANALWLGGWIAVAVALGRAGAVARWIAVGIPLSWVALLPGSQVGAGLAAGAFWMAVGTLMVTGGLRGAPAGPAHVRVAS